VSYRAPPVAWRAETLLVGAVAVGLGSCSWLHLSSITGRIAPTGEKIVGKVEHGDSYTSGLVQLVSEDRKLFCMGQMSREEPAAEAKGIAFSNAGYRGDLKCDSGEAARFRFVSSDTTGKGVSGTAIGSIGRRAFSFEMVDDVGCSKEACRALDANTERLGIARLKSARGLQ
jgi:hypothetical protein